MFARLQPDLSTARGDMREVFKKALKSFCDVWYNFVMKHRALVFTVCLLTALSAVGITVAGVLTSLGVDMHATTAVGSVNTAVVGLLFVLVLVEIVAAIKIDDSTYHTALLTGCVMTQFLFSTDTQSFIAGMGVVIPDAVFGIISEIAYVLAVLCGCAYIVFLYGVRINMKAFASSLVPAAALIIGYSLDPLYGFGYILHFAVAALLSVDLCAIVHKIESRKSIGFTTYFTIALLCLSTAAQNINALYFSEQIADIPGISLAYATLSFAMYIPVYLRFTIHSDNKAVKSTEYRQQAEQFQAKALMGQIKPHFIFNSLEAVRNLYHRNTADGDAAIKYLSDFLRASVTSFDSDLIPFETELDNVFSYTELENLKRDKKTDVIFNIDFTDFSVPPFSIQTFVENAVKHSGVEETGGSIIISSYKSGNTAVVKVVDNGRGFNLADITGFSHGIKNASDRFALTLGAKPEIVSKPAAGTCVKIVINLESGGGGGDK